ncbi:hypothetical protein ACTXT7_001141 [Hymenolepis weldensis]
MLGLGLRLIFVNTALFLSVLLCYEDYNKKKENLVMLSEPGTVSLFILMQFKRREVEIGLVHPEVNK